MTGRSERAPMHLWLVGGVTSLWNSFGVVDYVLTQTRNAGYLAQFTEEQRAYFDAFPTWMEAAWAFGVWGALAGSLLLLFRSRFAVAAFAMSLTGLAVSTLWQFGFSGADMDIVFPIEARIMTAIIWAIAIALLLYARRMRARGVLR